MKQLYKIGIIVAVLLLVLLGFTKITNKQDTVNDMPEIEIPEVVSEAVQDPPSQAGDDLQDKEIETTMEGNTTVVMKTNKGDITIELFTKDMPVTAGNFLKLAQEDYYDGIKFHRVISNFMIQGGDPNSKDDSKLSMWGTGGPGYAIDDEFAEGYSNARGTLSMANSGPNTGGSQFFINLVDNSFLDFDKEPLTSKHPVFGRVIDGMDVVDSIAGVETGARDVPVEPIVIEDIEVK